MTQIIEVIPQPVRIALTALGALGLALGAVAGFLALRQRRLKRQSLGLAADVGLLSSTLLPAVPEHVGAASVSVAYRPAEGLAAGGDFYDAFALADGRTCLILGDVEGHGREAIALTALMRYTLRAYVQAGVGPRSALQLASHVLGPQLGMHLVTAVVAVYDAHRSTLTYACAGHPAPVLIGADQHSPSICSSPPLGAGMPTGRRQVTVPLPPDSAAFFYTDGVVDPRVDGGRFGSERLADELRARGPNSDAQDVLIRILHHSDEQTDDMAACVLRPLPGPVAGAPVRVEELELDAAMLERWGTTFLTACGAGSVDIESALADCRQTLNHSPTAVLTVRIETERVGLTVSRTGCGRAVDALGAGVHPAGGRRRPGRRFFARLSQPRLCERRRRRGTRVVLKGRVSPKTCSSLREVRPARIPPYTAFAAGARSKAPRNDCCHGKPVARRGRKARGLGHAR